METERGNGESGEARLVDAAWRQAAELWDGERPDGPPLAGYRLLKRIHRGGQGVVYQAIEEASGHKVAIKVQREGPWTDATAAARFEREVRVLSGFDHPGVVRIRDSGFAGGSAYYVMDYVAGRPLDVYRGDEEPTPRRTVELLRDVCDAVAYAHRRGVVHRDLKPGNVLVDDEDRPRVLDFGLAKLAAGGRSSWAEDGFTITGQFLGSLPWASPEQVEGRPDEVGARSDVYSLGVLLYQLLTGGFPYPVGGSPREVARNIVHAEPRPPRCAGAPLDADIETVLFRCLAKEPARRYPSAVELESDLARYLAGDRIDAKRDSTWYVVRKTLRRHPIAMTSAAFVLLLGALTIVLLAFAHRRESALRVDAERQARIARAVSDFLNEDLLAAVRPDAQGKDVTMLEVLDAGASRIEGRFADEPAVEAAVRATLGETYMHLGSHEEAEHHLARSLELHREASGPEHVATLAALDLFARVQRRLTRYDEAAAHHAEMVETARRVLGDEHELTLRGMSNAAITLARLGRYEEAEETNGIVLDARLRALGEEHADTLTSMNNQAHYLYQQRRFEESRPLNERVLAVRRRVLGDDHPHTILSMNNLAIEHGSLPIEQEALLVEALARGEAVFGEAHPRLVLWRINLGICYLALERHDEARDLLHEALASAREQGEQHPNVAFAHEHLAHVEMASGRLDLAERHATAARDVLSASLGPDHLDTVDADLLLADVHHAARRFPEAEAILLARFAEYEERFGPSHPLAGHVSVRLADLYEDWGLPECAEPYRREGGDR